MTSVSVDTAGVETVEEATELAINLQEEARVLLDRAEENQEWVVEDRSPTRKLYRLFNAQDGEMIMVPRFIFNVAIRRRVNGKPMFVARASDAAPRIEGKVKCFLHPDAPEHTVLRSIGIAATCSADGLRNTHSKRVHAQNRHKGEWAAYREFLEEKEAADARKMAQKQLDATLRLAAAATKGQVPEPEETSEEEAE